MKNAACPDSAWRSDCAISRALDAIGDRWSLLILRDLLFSDKRTYGEFLASKEGIATNILASRLSALEGSGLVRKTPDPANGRRGLYHLTEKGIDLLPVVLEIMHWMARHDPDAHACSNQLQRLETDRCQFLQEQIERLRQEHLPAPQPA